MNEQRTASGVGGGEPQPPQTGRGSQHPNGGPISGATTCPHCHRDSLIDGSCRECDWPG